MFLGFAFINYSSFEAADAALEAMNGQYLCNRPITIRFVRFHTVSFIQYDRTVCSRTSVEPYFSE